MTSDTTESTFGSACPSLQPQLEVAPLAYRGERWYMLRNTANLGTVRLSENAYAAVAMMDGEHCIDDIGIACEKRFGSDAPTTEEIAQLLVQLGGAGFLLGGLPAELQSLVASRVHRQGSWKLQSFSPTAVRIPLCNPERLLDRLRSTAQWMFTPRLMLAWLLLMVSCIALAIAHIDEISSALAPNFWTVDHTVLLALTYIAIKLVHELSHGLAIKAWGGEVREVGIMLLWFFPCPYVDGTAAAIFPDKRKRAVVAAAGIMAELTLAAIGLLVFLAVEPGLIRTMALDVMLVGTVSTLLANGNPLLKFDGYYVLEDLVEIPNLATRAQRYYLYLVQRYLFGLGDVHSPATAIGERGWFLAYAPLAIAYRVVLVLSIALVFSEHYLAAGVAVASFAVFHQLVLPLIRGTTYLIKSPQLVSQRSRAVAVTGITLLAVVLFIGFVPLSSTTYAEGVIGTVEQDGLYTQSDGFIREVLVEPYTQVSGGQPLVSIENAELQASIVKLKSRRRELQILRLSAQANDRAAAMSFTSDLRAVDSELTLREQRQTSLVIQSQAAGEFVPIDHNALLGRYVQQGQLLGHVVSQGARVVTAVVTQSEVGRIRSGVDKAYIRMAEKPMTTMTVGEVRETPGGDFSLPSRILGVAGGGRLSIDANDQSGVTTVERIFRIELTLPEHIRTARLGGRAHVRFDHRPEPLISHMSRSIEQLLLRHFGI